ncbi:MAG: hypothetical protein RL582_2045 [Bacteroidota bacterium]
MKKLIRYFKSWIRFRIYYYFKILRPSNFKINGNLKFDIFSFIDLKHDSEITIEKNVRLIKSRFYVHSSNCKIESETKIIDSIVYIENSRIHLGKSTQLNNIQFSLYNQSEFKCGNHVLLDGSKHSRAGFYAYDSKISWGNNVNHYAHSQCNQGSWIAGDNIFINWGTQIRCDCRISMGSNILISYDCILFDTNTHSLDFLDRRKEIQQGYPNTSKQFPEDKIRIKKKPILIGDDVWIGTRSFVFKGSELGNGVIVGAGSVVSGLIAKDGSKVVGNPAQIK